MLTRIHLTVAAVLASVAPFSQSAAQGTLITVAGIVTDATTGAPLGGVVIRVRLTTVYETFTVG